MKRILITLGLTALVMLAGCNMIEDSSKDGSIESERASETKEVKVTKISGGDVFRFNDTDAGVTCWVFDVFHGYAGAGGVTCLPTNETALNSTD